MRTTPTDSRSLWSDEVTRTTAPERGTSSAASAYWTRLRVTSPAHGLPDRALGERLQRDRVAVDVGGPLVGIGVIGSSAPFFT